jgi:hypothetical protein
VFGVAARHESGGFFMPNRDETDPVLPFSQGFGDRVDTVTYQPENERHVPIDQGLDQQIGRVECRIGAHRCSLRCGALLSQRGIQLRTKHVSGSQARARGTGNLQQPASRAVDSLVFFHTVESRSYGPAHCGATNAQAIPAPEVGP